MNHNIYLTPLITLAVMMLLAVGVALTLRFVFMGGGPARRFTAYVLSFVYFFISLGLALFLRIYLVRLLLSEHGISASSQSIVDAPYALISSLLLFRLLTKVSSGGKKNATTNQGMDFDEDYDDYYQEALKEVSESRTIGALWARALVDAEGNADLASSKYIAWRVQRLKEQNAKTEINPEGADDDKEVSYEEWISNKLLVVIIGILSALIIMLGLYGYKLLVEQDRSKLDDYLNSSVSEFKLRGPIMIDSMTQLFSVQRTSRDELTISFRLPNNLVYDRAEYENFLRVELASEKCRDLEESISLGAKFVFIYYSGEVVIGKLRLDERICRRVPLRLSDPAASVQIP